MANLSALAKDKHKPSRLRNICVAVVATLSAAAILFCIAAYAVGDGKNDDNDKVATSVCGEMRQWL